MTVPYRWSRDAEKREWMLLNAGGRPIAEVQEDFEREFGTPISKTQVSLFRAEYDLGRRRGNRTAHRRNHVPVGTERVNKGYVMVKVRELPDQPQSKDNWEFKHVLVWERTRGLALPSGWMVLFCDHDARNFDPMNLKAVPRMLIGVMNGGPEWNDRDTCEACVAIAWLRRGMADAENAPRRCGVCGREFVPDIRNGSQRTCRDCLDKGLRSPKDYGWRTCPVCGEKFPARSARATYCSKKCRNKAQYERNVKRERGCADGGP